MTPDPEPPPDSEPDVPLVGSQVWARLWTVANVIAPTTALTTLLFCFGYVATTARFRCFGVRLDMVDLSLQEMLLYGVEVVYPPLIVLAILSLLVIAAHAAVRWMVSSPDRDAITGWVGLFTVLLGPWPGSPSSSWPARSGRRTASPPAAARLSSSRTTTPSGSASSRDLGPVR